MKLVLVQIKNILNQLADRRKIEEEVLEEE
jgi:hypothetical protein